VGGRIVVAFIFCLFIYPALCFSKTTLKVSKNPSLPKRGEISDLPRKPTGILAINPFFHPVVNVILSFKYFFVKLN